MNDLIPTIESLHDEALAQRLQSRIDSKTKPLGSLGQLETLMLRLGLVLGTETPLLKQPLSLIHI